MNAADEARAAYSAAPVAALAAIRRSTCPLLVDLDETLYLRNSTEDFLNGLRPRLLGALAFRALALIKPWRWTGGEATRDVWRLRVARLLDPGLQHRWTRRARALAAQHVNADLRAALIASGQKLTVVTVGFEPIVAPLIAAMELPLEAVVACRDASFADRATGKLALTRAALGDDAIAQAMLVTDSPDDLPLMQQCARGLLVQWPDARYEAALRDTYLPLRYVSEIKRPGEKYLSRGILQEDFAFWVLASITLSTQPLLHVLGLSMLLVSFWVIYELGYMDNDDCAARFEAHPKLSAAYPDRPAAPPRWIPWTWAGLFGVGGVCILSWPQLPHWQLLAWAALLLALHALFWLYNRVDKPSRVWLFALLQLARSASFAVVAPITPAGAAALGAHSLARWTPYVSYRSAGGAWPQETIFLPRLAMYVVLLMVTAGAHGRDTLGWVSALLLLGWNGFRARRELMQAWRGMHRIDRELSV